MKKLLILICCLVFAGCTSMNFGVSSLSPQTDIPETANKENYELYSWKVNDDWGFSLFTNATRVPSFADITSAPEVIIGAQAAMEKILQLPAGTRVYWNLKRIKGMGLPDAKTIDKMQTAAKKAHIYLEIIAWP